MKTLMKTFEIGNHVFDTTDTCVYCGLTYEFCTEHNVVSCDRDKEEATD